MTIETFKLDNGEEFKIDTSLPEFKAYERAAEQVGISKKDDSFFFARNLEFIRQQVFKPKYNELKLLNGGLLPINSAIPEGAETDTYDTLDSAGEATIVADFADDIKTVEVFGAQELMELNQLRLRIYILCKICVETKCLVKLVVLQLRIKPLLLVEH